MLFPPHIFPSWLCICATDNPTTGVALTLKSLPGSTGVCAPGGLGHLGVAQGLSPAWQVLGTVARGSGAATNGAGVSRCRGCCGVLHSPGAGLVRSSHWHRIASQRSGSALCHCPAEGVNC